MTEHIVRVQNGLVVKIDVCECIETFENQVYVGMRKGGCIGLKCSLILPVGQADPLEMELVILVEGIGDEVVVQQVGLNDSGNLRRMPFLDVGAVRICNGSKLPAGIKASRGGVGGLERYPSERNDQQKQGHATCKSAREIMQRRFDDYQAPN